MTARAAKVKIIVRKKKAKHAAHHGGAWKVAYADFVTAMMALFIVLWLLTQADLEMRSQIARYFRDPGVLSGGATVGATMDPAREVTPRVVNKDVIVLQNREMEQMAQQSEQLILERQERVLHDRLARAVAGSPDLEKLDELVRIRVTDAGLVIDLVDDAGAVLFDRSSATLKPALIRLLEQIGEVLAEMPNDIEIGGHTDSQPYVKGSGKTNWDLSFERAAAARAVLESKGLKPGRIKRVLAHADSDLLVPENPMDPRNRRLSILAARRLPVAEKR